MVAVRERAFFKVHDETDCAALKCDNNSVEVSGCEESRILSERACVAVFLCGICSKLVSLDCVMSNCCNAPFCRSCINEYELERTRDLHQVCPCPNCEDNESDPSSNDSKEFTTRYFTIMALRESQPLAYQILKVFQIACLHDTCAWRGNYSDFVIHQKNHRKMLMESENSEKTITLPNMEPSAHERLKNRKERTYTIDSAPNADFIDHIFYSNDFDENDNTMSSLKRGGSYNDEDVENVASDRNEHQELFDQVEKLKKQANAKFNSGNLHDAKVLYTTGISLVKGSQPETDDERRLLSDMHSNRAATLYRLKKFDECIVDCEKAIRYDPALEKAWVRKWRSLMAKGNLNGAHSFLGEAVAVTQSSRIKEEYDRSIKEMALYSSLKRLLETGDLQHAEEVIRASFDHSRSDNLLLLTQCATLMIEKGDSKLALEYINKGLEVNPTYMDCVELQGLCHFFDGKFERSLRLLAASRDETNHNTQIDNAWKRVHKSYDLYKKAESEMKIFRYSEANEHLTALIKASEPLPSKSTLFAKIRADRANNALQMSQHLSALQDCQDVIDVHREYAPVWIIRANILLAIGKVKEARLELRQIRKTWGENDPTIESTYRKVDFEFRVARANDDVLSLQRELHDGTCDTIPAHRSVDSLKRTGHVKRPKAAEIAQAPQNSMDRWINHSERETSNDGPPKVNPSESMSRMHCHVGSKESYGPKLVNESESYSAGNEKHNVKSVQDKNGIDRRSSFHETETLRKSSSHGKGEIVRRSSFHDARISRKSSFNEKHNNSKLELCSAIEYGEAKDLPLVDAGTETLRKSSSHSNSRGLVRRSSFHDGRLTRKSSFNENHYEYNVEHYRPTAHESNGYDNDEEKDQYTEPPSGNNPRRKVERRNSINNTTSLPSGDSGKNMPHRRRPMERRKSIGSHFQLSHSSENHTDSAADPIRRIPGKSKSSDDVLLRSDSHIKYDHDDEPDPCSDRKQAHRVKTLDGIFGCDWQHQSGGRDAQPCPSEKPVAQRSKSSDLFELRKMLIGKYCPKKNNN